MRIRSKLITLIAVPLIALTLIAAFGFSNQSVAIEAAEEAELIVARTQAVQDAVLAIGGERLLTIAGETDAIDSARSSTNAALAALTALDYSRTNQMADRASDLVRQARNEDVGARSGLYGTAIAGLLTVELDDAASYPNAAARNAAVANNAAVQAMHLRERAWITYFQLEDRRNLDPDAVASVIADFAVANGTLRTVVDLADAGGSADFNAVLQTNGAVRLSELEVRALDDLNEGEVTVSPAQVIDGLVDYRGRWSQAIGDEGQAITDAVSNELQSANNLRSLFSLLAIFGSVVLAGLIFVIYRSITNPLEALLVRASQVADVELPQLTNALRNAESSDSLPEPQPIPVETNDEIGELVEAFNNVQTTAFGLATEQALSRRNVAEMFVNLGRRNQQLLQRILSQLTKLEQHEEDPDKLRELFELDHIVTRMRRNAESLLALAGAQTARQWSQPIEIENTVRAAFGEVEGYERINVANLTDAMVAGRAVADITHLLAELLENGLNFSDSQTMVEVNGHMTNDGYVITVRDEGIGMSLSELEENNNRITDPPRLDQVPTRFIGLYVVGRLADRHGIAVRLTEAEVNGIVARIVLPKSILAGEQTPIDLPAPVVAASDVNAEAEAHVSPEAELDAEVEVEVSAVVEAADNDTKEDNQSEDNQSEDNESEEKADSDESNEVVPEEAAASDLAKATGKTKPGKTKSAKTTAAKTDAETADAEAANSDTSAEESDNKAPADAEAEEPATAEVAETPKPAQKRKPVRSKAQRAARKPKAAPRRKAARAKSRKEDAEQSPLEEKHDLEAELAALTGESPAEDTPAEDTPAEATADTNKLPRRSRRSEDSAPTEEAATDAADGGSDVDPPSDWVGLPVRKRGSSLESAAVPEVPKAAIERRAATDTSTESASSFSSMLSAFSSGIDKGLEAAEDEDQTKGEDR